MKKIILIVCFMMIPALCFSELYKWTDQNGVTHYGMHPPPDAKVEKTLTEEKTDEIKAAQFEAKKLIEQGFQNDGVILSKEY